MRDIVRKTLEELADDYDEAVKILEVRIAERNARMKEFPKASREASVIKSELSILYSERRDTLESARFLRKYYLKEE